MGYTLENSTHLDTADRPALGRTTPELAVLFAAALCAGAALHQRGVALPPRLAECAAILLVAAIVVLYRPHGRSLALWTRTIAAHLVAGHHHVWAPADGQGRRGGRATAATAGGEPPPHLAGHLAGPPTPGRGPGDGAAPEDGTAAERSAPAAGAGAEGRPGGDGGAERLSRRRSRTQDRPYVPVAIGGGAVTFGDGRRLAVLECSGPATARLDEDGEPALHVATHRALLGWPFPLQLWIWADPLDLRAYTARREADLATLPPALRPLFSSDISFMVREARRLEALDLRAFVVVPGPPVRAGAGGVAQALLRRGLGAVPSPGVASPEEGERALADRCARVARGLAGARVRTWRLADDALEDIWYRLLCPRSARLQPLDAGHTDPDLDTSILFHA